MNTTGQAPAIGSRIEMLPAAPARANRAQIAAPRANQLALPQPATRAATGHLQVQGGGAMNHIGNWLAQRLGGVQYDASVQDEIDEPESIDDAVEKKKEVGTTTSPLEPQTEKMVAVKTGSGPYKVNKKALPPLKLND